MGSEQVVARSEVVRVAGEAWMERVKKLPSMRDAAEACKDIHERTAAKHAVSQETARLRPSHLTKFSDEHDLNVVRRGTNCTEAARRLLWRELHPQRTTEGPALSRSVREKKHIATQTRERRAALSAASQEWAKTYAAKTEKRPPSTLEKEPPTKKLSN